MWGDTMTKYRIGDRVYPINYNELLDLKEMYADDDFDQFDFVGIITEVSRYSGEYSIAWLNRDRTESRSRGIKCAWWDEEDLTDDRELFLHQFQF